jgi:hypothetical protein
MQPTGSIHRQTGNIGALLLLILALLAVATWATWRYAPEYLPGFVRLQLPLSPLDPLSPTLPAEAGPGVVAAPAPAGPREANPPLYKWKDAKGVWNVTDQPPKGRDYETVRVNPDTNVVPSEPVPEEPAR